MEGLVINSMTVYSLGCANLGVDRQGRVGLITRDLGEVSASEGGHWGKKV